MPDQIEMTEALRAALAMDPSAGGLLSADRRMHAAIAGVSTRRGRSGRRLRRPDVSGILSLVRTAAILGVVGLAVLASLPRPSPGGASPSAPPPGVGDPAPALLAADGRPLLDLSGTPFSLADGYGRPQLLVFLSTWCPPCTAELPEVDAIARAGDHGVSVVVVAVDDATDAVRAGMGDTADAVRTVLDPDGAAAVRYGVPGLPVHVLLDPAGRVVAETFGLPAGGLGAWLTAHLGPPSSSTSPSDVPRGAPSP